MRGRLAAALLLVLPGCSLSHPPPEFPPGCVRGHTERVAFGTRTVAICDEWRPASRPQTLERPVAARHSPPRASRDAPRHLATPDPAQGRTARRRTLLACLRSWETTSGDYRARNAASTASGAYGIVDGTWDGYGGYAHAYLAPRVVQDAKANALLDEHGLAPWTFGPGTTGWYCARRKVRG